jgi:hypothetical protein
MVDVDERIGGFINLGRILTIILIIGAMLLVGGAIYVGRVILTDTTVAFYRRLPLPGQHILEISKLPVGTTWDLPSDIPCSFVGICTHTELSTIYSSPSTHQVLVSIELPGR